MFKDMYQRRFHREMQLGELETYYQLVQSIIDAHEVYSALAQSSKLMFTDTILEEFIRKNDGSDAGISEIQLAVAQFTSDNIDDIARRLGNALEYPFFDLVY